VSGAGASHTLGKLGSINSLAGAFVVALSAALTVFWMTRAGLPVSTSQPVVGAIIGWNIFSGHTTSVNTLEKIVSTWIFTPILAAIFAIIIFFVIRLILNKSRIHIISLDHYTRVGLIIVGAFGSYSLGANNIGNVIGVFIPASPFRDYVSAGFSISSLQQLFLLGGIAIAVGVLTYSKRVMLTVGKGIFRLSPITAFVAVLSSSLVLFIFASQGLHDLLISLGLPAFPLVPVSSSQAIVGAVMGISLAKGGRNLNFMTLGKISIGWLATPIASAIICYILLFFMQNVFLQQVF
jgi:PiT family inorganic phosphate transporter